MRDVQPVANGDFVNLSASKPTAFLENSAIVAGYSTADLPAPIAVFLYLIDISEIFIWHRYCCSFTP
jgi:hypothetical protein